MLGACKPLSDIASGLEIGSRPLVREVKIRSVFAQYPSTSGLGRHALLRCE
jgi:hypothetical protein